MVNEMSACQSCSSTTTTAASNYNWLLVLAAGIIGGYVLTRPNKQKRGN